MNEHDMTEQAYKNGYEAGAIELGNRLKQGRPNDLVIICVDALDNILKDMVGDNNDTSRT